MYYIQTHANSGYLYLKLPGNSEWSRWNIEYACDALHEVKESGAKEITVSQLPLEIIEGFEFVSLKEYIKSIYEVG